MGFLNREQILTADDLKKEVVEVPEWPGADGKPGQVCVRAAMACERDEYEQNIVQTKVIDGKTETVENFINARSRMVVKCVIDEQGHRIFKDADAPLLGKKNAAAVQRLFRQVQKLSGMTREAVKELEGNSSAGQSDASPSLSPAT